MSVSWSDTVIKWTRNIPDEQFEDMAIEKRNNILDTYNNAVDKQIDKYVDRQRAKELDEREEWNL